VGEIVKPGDIVAVNDFSPETLREVLAHLEVSTAFEHFIFREAELGAIWSLIGFEQGSERVERLREAVLKAHDELGRKRPKEAIKSLEPFTRQDP
jgi:hypothetical protein